MNERQRLTERILAVCERLPDAERQQIAAAASAHAGCPVEWTTESLSGLELSILETIHAIIGGLLLTKERVPDMAQAYEWLKDADLPRRTSFGRPED